MHIRHLRDCLLAFAGTFACLTTLAGEFEREDFTLRFSAALSRLSTFADVAGQGGASAASVRSTSVNPAALVWRPIRDPRGALLSAASVQYNGLFFARGTELTAASESLNYYPAQDWALKFSATQLRSNEEPVRQGPLFEFDLNAWRIDIGHRFASVRHPFALGLQLAYSQSETNAVLPAGEYPVGPGAAKLPFRKQPVRDSDRQSFSVRFGWQISVLPVVDAADDRLLAGVVIDYANHPTKLGTFHAAPAIAGVTQDAPDTERVTFQQLLVRGGVAWKYLDRPWHGNSVVRRVGYARLDYQWGWFARRGAELQVHRVTAGGNYPILPNLQVNAGVTADDRRHLSWSAGLSFFPTRTMSLEAAYQHDLLPEIADDFGHAETVVVSAGMAF